VDYRYNTNLIQQLPLNGRCFEPDEKGGDYRQHAAECRQMAKRILSPEHRQMLAQMAENWESLVATGKCSAAEVDFRA
jgi:hypothetical protein